MRTLNAVFGALALAGGATLGALTSGALAEQRPRPGLAAAQIIPVGHRGTMKFAPENTLAAHEAAIARGARVIEMDVRMTSDGHFILMHDARADRTTDGAGRVAKMTLAEIRRLDAGSWFAPEFAGERVPTLREALRNLRGRAAVDIDFKDGPPNSGEIIADILDAEGYANGPLVTVFARAWHYRRLAGAAPRYALRPHYIDARTTARRARDGVAIMGLRRASFSFAAARVIRDNNMVLFANVMGADDGPEGFADSAAAGARFIQTDHIEDLVAWLDSQGLLATCVPARDLSCWAPPAASRLAAE